MMPNQRLAPFGQHARRLLELGYTPIPLLPGTKRPALYNWETLTPADITPEFIKRYAQCNTGILTGEVAPIDSDIYDKGLSKAVRDRIFQTIDAAAPARIGQRPKCAFLFRRDNPDAPKRSSGLWRDAQGRDHRIEVLGRGQQLAVYGLHPDTGEPYMWPQRDLCGGAGVPLAHLPLLTDAQIDALFAFFDAQAISRSWTKVSRATDGEGGTETPMVVGGLTLEIAEDVLACYPNDDLHYDDWLRTGLALHHQFSGAVEAFELWDQWSATSHKYEGEAIGWKRWQSFDEDKPGGVSMRSILMEAEGQGWTRPDSVEGARVAQDDQFPELDDDEPSTTPGSVEGQGMADETEARPTLTLKNGRTVELLQPTTPAEWGSYDPPAQEWVWQGWLPRKETSVLYADGGIGKSALAQALATAVVTGEDYLGVPTHQGRVLMLMCEDNKDDVIRRQDRITALAGPGRGALGDDLALLPRKGMDNLLMTFPRGEGLGRPTALWEQLMATCLRLRPTLVVIDTAADAFGGNENVRAEVRQFIQQALTAIAEKCNCAVLLVAHVSRAGAAEGTGGSTAWHNTVRSRLFLQQDEQREGVLVLSNRKNNRGALQDDKLLRMLEGVPVLMAGEEDVTTAGDLQCREDFLLMLRELQARGREVSDSRHGGRYAPAIFTREQAIVIGARAHWKVTDFEQAMAWLLFSNVIELQENRRNRTRILTIVGDAEWME